MVAVCIYIYIYIFWLIFLSTEKLQPNFVGFGDNYFQFWKSLLSSPFYFEESKYELFPEPSRGLIPISILLFGYLGIDGCSFSPITNRYIFFSPFSIRLRSCTMWQLISWEISTGFSSSSASSKLPDYFRFFFFFFPSFIIVSDNSRSHRINWTISDTIRNCFWNLLFF